MLWACGDLGPWFHPLCLVGFLAGIHAFRHLDGIGQYIRVDESGDYTSCPKKRRPGDGLQVEYDRNVVFSEDGGVKCLTRHVRSRTKVVVEVDIVPVGNVYVKPIAFEEVLCGLE